MISENDKLNTEINADGEGEIVTYDSFDMMNLDDKLLRGIYTYGYEKPSAIQSKAIKPIVDGRDIIAQSQSGSGKTATFLIGNLNKIDLTVNKPQVLILAPNRELATQIHLVMQSLNTYLKCTSVLLIGGKKIDVDIENIEKGVQLIIGTPGRVYDMIKRYVLKTDKIKSFVLDEADEMLSRGFKDQIYDIFQYIPETSNVALFSATIPDAALEMTNKFMKNPVKILVSQENVSLQGIKQYYLGVESENWKIATLFDLYDKLSISQSIIFVNSKRKVDFIKEKLEEENFDVHCIHGEMSQYDREDIMTNFRKGKIRILLTTDIIARGIDVQQVSVVINYDIPKFREIYIHRIGRSGRYGRKGIAINFVTNDEYRELKEIVKFYNIELNTLPSNIKDLL